MIAIIAYSKQVAGGSIRLPPLKTRFQPIEGNLLYNFGVPHCSAVLLTRAPGAESPPSGGRQNCSVSRALPWTRNGSAFSFRLATRFRLQNLWQLLAIPERNFNIL